MLSGIVWFQTVARKIPLIMSAAPANVKKTISSQMFGISPAIATDAPQAAAARTIARP